MADQAPDAIDDQTGAVVDAFAALEDDVAAAGSTDEIHDLRDAPELDVVSEELGELGRYLQGPCDIEV